MPAPVYTQVLSGFSTSPAFYLEQSDRPLAIAVPSLSAPAEVRMTYAVTSGGPFAFLYRDDGSGQPASVSSGAGPAFGYVKQSPTPWAQVWLGAQATSTESFTIFMLSTLTKK